MSFDLVRGKLAVVIILATLTLCALFLARGVTSLLAGALLPLDRAPRVAAKGDDVDKLPGTMPPDVTAILKRNIFDPTTGPLWPPKPDEPEVDANATAEPQEVIDPGALPPACDGSARLVAAVYSERHPEWSFASMTAGSGVPLLYRQGSKFEDKEIDAIFPRAVFLRESTGRLCSIGMFNELPKDSDRPERPSRPETPPRRSVASATSRSGSISTQELEQNIKKNSDSNFAVQRGLVDKILQNQAEIMRSARIVPHEQNGQVVGVKMYGIRRNSLLGQLGLQNGDLLRSINGYDMASPDSALEAYARLRSANNLSVAITRRGKPMTVEYQIE